MNVYKMFRLYQRLLGILNTSLVKTEIQDFGKGSRFLCGSYVFGGRYIQIGSNSIIDKYVSITAQYVEGITLNEKCIVSIGDNCGIGPYSQITGIKNVRIGNGVRTGSSILISDNAHGEFKYGHLIQRPSLRPLYSKGEVVIGDNVWIGTKATILAGVHIGEGAIIGANAVVTKDVPEYSVAVGNPAHVVKQIQM